MKIRLFIIAIMVLAVCGWIQRPGHAFAQQRGPDAAPAASAALPANPAVAECLETILYGDLNYVNDDKAFPPPVRRECLQWLKDHAGAQLQEENRQRTVALSLDDEIKRNQAGVAAARAAKIANALLQFQEENDFLPSLPTHRTPAPAPPSEAAGNVDRKPQARLPQLTIERSDLSNVDYSVKRVKSGSNVISCGGVNRVSKPPIFFNKTFRGSGSISIVDTYFAVETADTVTPIAVRIGNRTSVIQSAVNKHMITIPFSKSELANLVQRGLEINSKAVDIETLKELNELVTRCLK